MELLDSFKIFLIQGTDTSSKVTVKNYVADVRKFIKWFETRFMRPFAPRLVTREIVAEFKNQNFSHSSQSQIAPASSMKRYFSSLRKFYQFLISENLVNFNPFQLTSEKTQTPTDNWHLKEFKNYLFLSHASKPTIKNYLADIRQFITWTETVLQVQGASDAATRAFARIDNNLIEEYKARLVYTAQLEPRSVNRKLSSLRKYFLWTNTAGILKNPLSFEQVERASTIPKPLPTESNLNELNEQRLKVPLSQDSISSSVFPPLRLFKKIGIASNWIVDMLIIAPTTGSLLALKYQLWKITGRQVFTSAQPIVKARSKLISTSLFTPTNSAIGSFSALDSFVTREQRPKLISVSNLPKEIYAPLSVSTANFTLARKILHHVKHNRPAWYKRYHSYPIVHYLHFAVFIVYATALGLTVYQAILQSPNFQAPVLASLPASPPRMLAFQGRLSDKTNNPIIAEKTLRFGLYDNQTASASSLLWQETQSIQPDNNGNFKTLLGKSQPIYQNLLTDNPKLYLGITIETETELTPRQQIATVTYSQDSAKVQGLSPITDPNAGTTNVLLALDSGGDLIVGGSASPRFEATGGEFTLSGKTLTLTTTEGSNSNVQIVPDGSGIVDIQKPIQNTTNYSNIPGVEGAVEFDDSVAIIATTSAQSAFIINQNSIGDLISANSNGIAKFKVDFLGAGTFASDVSINGNNLTSTSPMFNLLNRNVINLNIANDASNITIGASSGATTVNNNLRAQGGLTIPTDKNITLEGFTKSSIVFVDSNKQFAQDNNNFVWLQDSKRLGLGTNTPLYRLDVRDSQTTESVAQVFNTDQGSDADGLVVKLGTIAPGIANSFITFQNGNGDIMGKITGGTDSASIIFKPNGADYAEYYKKADPDEQFEQGDLVCITATNGVSKCDGSLPVLGVVSQTAGFVGGGNHDSDSTYVLVGIVGQLPAKIASDSGAITSGDALAIGRNGVMKATRKGVILGRALRSADPTTNQTVLVALNIGWYEPNLSINDKGDLLSQSLPPTGLLEGIIDTINLGIVEAKTISTKSLAVATDSLSIGGESLRDYITAITRQARADLENQLFTRKLISPIAEIAQVNTHIISPLSDDAHIAMRFEDNQISILNSHLSSQSAVATFDNQGNASFSGTLRARRIIADEIEGLNTQTATNTANYVTNITNIYNIGSPSAETASASANQHIIAAINQAPTTDYAHLSNDFTSTPSFSAEFAKFNQGLIALGGSSFGDVGITGTLRVGNAMRIEETSINTVGTDLALQPLRQGNLSLMGSLVTIDTEGNANFSRDLTVRGKLAANLIVPVPNQDLLMQLPVDESGKASKFEIQSGTGSAALSINQYGDVIASGSGSFSNIAAKTFTIIRGVQADTSLTQTVAQGSGGTAVIAANERERTIITPYIRPNSLIYVSPTSNTYGVTPYIARQTDKSFTIQIPYTVTRDIKLNWWIVN